MLETKQAMERLRKFDYISNITIIIYIVLDLINVFLFSVDNAYAIFILIRTMITIVIFNICYLLYY